ncbi:MAG: hypothetical protein R3B90_07385 [Planctomycetaceae bacterium]
MPQSLIDILLKMMAKQPADRYQSAAENAEVLAEWLRENGGDAWNAMRSGLADSSGDLTRPVDTSASTMGKGAKRNDKTTVGGDGASRPTGEVLTSTPQQSSSPRRRPTTPAAETRAGTSKAPATGDAALGAFLSNLSSEATADEEPPSFVDLTEASSRAPVSQTKPQPDGGSSVASRTTTQSRPTTSPLHRQESPRKEPVPVAAEPAAVAEIAEAEPVEAEAVLAEATEVGAVTTPRRQSAGLSRGTKLGIAGAVCAIAVVSIAVAVWPEGQTVDPPPTPDHNATAHGGNATDAPGTTGASTGRRPPDSPQEITVGPEGNFATIGEAVRYAFDNPPLTNLPEPRLIRVLGGGVFTERLDIREWSLGTLHIRAEGDQPTILRPEGPDPIILLDSSARTTIEGLTLDATDKPVAIQLIGPMPATRLLNLRISGFTQTGIVGERAKGLGGSRLEFDGLRMTAGSAAATAVRLTDSAFGLEKLTFRNVTIAGPMECGIQLDGTVREVVIEQSRFHDLKTALRFGGSSPEVEQLRVDSNVFHRVVTAIDFATPPVGGNRNTISRNLFVDLAGPEIHFAAPPDSALLSKLAEGGNLGGNRTTRAADTVKTNAWDLFGSGGQVGVPTPNFVSTDPESPEFLKPQ